ncbi:MAG: oligosaccharide flippase family protein, partial [Anaerolineae bacterium]
PATVESPLLDLMNVKYLLSEVPLEAPGFTLVYEGETRIYRNEEALPRAYAVPGAEVIDSDSEMLRRLSHSELTRVVLLEEDPRIGSLNRSAVSDPRYGIAITDYGLSDVTIRAQMPEPGWLVLTDAYSTGWQAFVSSEGVPERELPLYRANFQFRAVPLDAGEHTVRFRYFPWSVKLGLYFSFISGMTLLGGAGAWAWRRFYRESPGQTAAERVLKNTTIPLMAQLFNKAVDLGFALLVLRVLGPEGQGKYAFAIFLVGYVEIVSNFGLNTLLAREVAKDPAQGNRFLSGTAILRLLLLTGLAPIVLLFILLWRSLFDLSGETAAAIVLLTLALVPGSLSAALSSLFTAHERMEIPAAVSSVATLLKVGLGALALLLGFGFVGLAAVAVVVNVTTLAVLFQRVVRTLFRPRFEWDRRFSGGLLGVSFPLMINHLLNTVFFRIDILLLQPLRGNTEVGWYSAAYKVLDGLLLIPSTVTIALFPMLSRFAEEAPDTLLRTYRLALKLLLSLAIPISILVSAFSDPIIAILGGPQYLPQASTALRILIWFLPLSFVNGLTQYVLISVNQQRYLTRAFLIGTGFNLVANLAVIPQYGFQGAAGVTVLSEVALFIPFALGVRRYIAPIPWLQLAGRPAVAGAAMAAVLVSALSVSPFLALLGSLAAYPAVIFALGTFSPEERSVLRQVLPFRARLPGRG